MLAAVVCRRDTSWVHCVEFHTRKIWMLSFTSNRLTGENLSDTLWIRVWVGPTTARILWTKENLFLFPIIGPGFRRLLIYSPVTLPAKLSFWVMNHCNRVQNVIFSVHPKLYKSKRSTACIEMKGKFEDSVPLGCYTCRLAKSVKTKSAVKWSEVEGSVVKCSVGKGWKRGVMGRIYMGGKVVRSEGLG